MERKEQMKHDELEMRISKMISEGGIGVDAYYFSRGESRDDEAADVRDEADEDDQSVLS